MPQYEGMPDYEEYDDQTVPRGKSRRGGQVLTIRMLVAKTEWLDGEPSWRGGEVVWSRDGVDVSVATPLLTRAQRALHQIRDHPRAAQSALGDAAAWVQTRQARLELAKRLSKLSVPALEAVVGRAMRHEGPAIAALTELLEVEAHCLLGPRPSPAIVLTQVGPPALPAIQAFLHRAQPSLEAAVLAALVAGAIGGEPPQGRLDPRIGAAFAWGARRDRASEPALVAHLLTLGASSSAIDRILRAHEPEPALSLQTVDLRTLLARGVAVERVAALVESSRRLRILSLADPPPIRRTRPQRPRSRTAAQLGELGKLCRECLVRTADPAVAPALLDALLTALPLSRPGRPSYSLMSEVVNRSRQLDPSLLIPYLQVVRAYCGDSTPGGRPVESSDEIWRRQRQSPREWWRAAMPRVARAVQRLSDPGLTLEVLRLGGSTLPLSPECWRCLIELGRRHGLGPDGILELADELPGSEDPRVIRSELETLSSALGEPGRQGLEHLLYAYLAAAPTNPADRRRIFEPLTRWFLPRLLRYTAPICEGGRCLCSELTTIAIALTRAPAAFDRPAIMDLIAAEEAARLAEMTEQGRERTWEDVNAVETSGLLAIGLSGDDPSVFAATYTRLRDLKFNENQDVRRGVLTMLSSYPSLREPLRTLLLRHPRRGARVATRLSMMERLGSATLALLRDPPAPRVEVGQEWGEIIALGPQAQAAVEEFLRRVPGAPVAPGARRLAGLPDRLQRELAHLLTQLEEQSTAAPRPDLSLRIESLRARIGDPASLRHRIAQEMKELLDSLGAELQAAALEARVEACIRRRLTEVVGPAMAELPLDHDLINAALLTADIRRNRGLLRRLLRAHVRGNVNWAREQPANVRYLEELAARGVDVRTWLSERKRRRKCEVLPGGTLTLWLETHPLRILQMGNLFDTCLSVGGCNSYSTVANAVDANKRVLYARDGRGRIVARKLLAITSEGELAGFRTYCSLPPAEAEIVVKLVRDYCVGFATACGLSRVETGVIPHLVALAWYDDGIEPWDPSAPRGASESPDSRTSRMSEE